MPGRRSGPDCRWRHRRSRHRSGLCADTRRHGPAGAARRPRRVVRRAHGRRRPIADRGDPRQHRATHREQLVDGGLGAGTPLRPRALRHEPVRAGTDQPLRHRPSRRHPGQGAGSGRRSLRHRRGVRVVAVRSRTFGRRTALGSRRRDADGRRVTSRLPLHPDGVLAAHRALPLRALLAL